MIRQIPRMYYRLFYDNKVPPNQHLTLWYKFGYEELVITVDGNTMYVAICGSDDIKDWALNFFFIKQHIGEGVRVHKGFYQSYKNLEFPIMGQIAIHSPKRIVFLGHSRGGAVCQLCACLLPLPKGIKVECINSGSPRIGNKKFRDMMNKRVPNHKRLAIKSDMVTHVPKINFYHAGELVELPKQVGLLKSHNIKTYIYETRNM